MNVYCLGSARGHSVQQRSRFTMSLSENAHNFCCCILPPWPGVALGILPLDRTITGLYGA